MYILGDRLRESRERMGVGQRELARRLELGETQIYRYESGQSEPTIGRLVKIAQELNVSIDYLVGFTDDPFIQKSENTDEEQRLLLAFRTDNAEAVMTLFAEKLRKHRQNKAVVIGVEPAVNK